MEQRLKHRLVGASVLLALAVLILPDVLDGEKAKREQNFAVIPLQPELTDVEFNSPKAPQHLEREKEPVIEELPTEPVPATTKADTPKIEQQAVNPTDKKLPQFKGSGWVLQLGVFRNANNVNELIAKIRKSGYPAFSKPKKAVQGEPTWVYVGPDLNKDKLLSYKPELKTLTGLNGKVYPYNPQSQ